MSVIRDICQTHTCQKSSRKINNELAVNRNSKWTCQRLFGRQANEAVSNYTRIIPRSLSSFKNVSAISGDIERRKKFFFLLLSVHKIPPAVIGTCVPEVAGSISAQLTCIDKEKRPSDSITAIFTDNRLQTRKRRQSPERVEFGSKKM